MNIYYLLERIWGRMNTPYLQYLKKYIIKYNKKLKLKVIIIK